MIDRDTLKLAGWSDELIDDVLKVAQGLGEDMDEIPDFLMTEDRIVSGTDGIFADAVRLDTSNSVKVS